MCEPMDTHSESHHSIIQPIETDNSPKEHINSSNRTHVTNRVCFFFWVFPFLAVFIFYLCGMGFCFLFFHSLLLTNR